MDDNDSDEVELASRERSCDGRDRAMSSHRAKVVPLSRGSSLITPEYRVHIWSHAQLWCNFLSIEKVRRILRIFFSSVCVCAKDREKEGKREREKWKKLFRKIVANELVAGCDKLLPVTLKDGPFSVYRLVYGGITIY